MEILHADLGSCSGLTGTIVVIDVLGSFSTEAHAFASCARAIYPVENETAAWQLLHQRLLALTMGAFWGGVSIHGFDLTNSPAKLAGRDVRGRDIFHCTEGGTRGLVSCRQVDAVFTASMMCARVNARQVLRLAPSRVTLVITRTWVDRDGDEDRACADHLEALLWGQAPDAAPYVERVRQSDLGRRFTDPDSYELPASDLDDCAVADRAHFAMPVRLSDGYLVMKPVK